MLLSFIANHLLSSNFVPLLVLPHLPSNLKEKKKNGICCQVLWLILPEQHYASEWGWWSLGSIFPVKPRNVLESSFLLPHSSCAWAALWPWSCFLGVLWGLSLNMTSLHTSPDLVQVNGILPSLPYHSLSFLPLLSSSLWHLSPAG